MGLRKVDAVLYCVEDIHKAAKFYEETMGLKRGWTDEDNQMIGLLFPGNDTELVLHSNKYLPNPNVSYQVENVEEFVSDYKQKGNNVIVEPFEIRCGKCAILKDPFGGSIEIMDITKFGGKPRFDA